MGKLQEEYEVEIEEATVAADPSITDTDSDDSNPDVYYGSEGWNDYVMNLFHEDELIDGNPLCHGLRRVANMLLGNIVVSRPTQVFPSEDPNGPGRSTVLYEVVFDWMNTGDLRTFGDVAEVWHGNTDDLFLAHPAATACTKAEGRVLRKALMVKCLAAEELAKNKDVAGIVKNLVKSGAPTSGEISPSDLISGPQTNFIDGKCRQLGINVKKYINMGEKKYNHHSKISKQEASQMIKTLNTYQTNDNSIPVDILGYDPDWKG